MTRCPSPGNDTTSENGIARANSSLQSRHPVHLGIGMPARPKITGAGPDRPNEYRLCRADFVRVTEGEFGKERKKNNFDMWEFLNSKNWVSEEPLIVMLSQE